MSIEEAKLQNPNLRDIRFSKNYQSLKMDTRFLYVGGQKVDWLHMTFVDNKLTEITLYFKLNDNFYSQQDYAENQEFNSILSNSYKLVSYFDDRLGPCVKKEMLFIDNNKIKEKSNEEFTNGGNTYCWWTSESLITVRVSKTLILNEYSHLYTISLYAK